MATNTYDSLKQSIAAAGWGELPAWSSLDEAAQQTTFRSLRRLAVARALDSGDAFSDVEKEAGLGEDAALRNFLLCTGVLIALEREEPVAGRHPVGAALESCLPAAALDRFLASAWVYRAEPLVAWSPLHEVGAGFVREDDEDLKRLTAARHAWDEATLSQRLDWVGETLTALIREYVQGRPAPVGAPRKVFGDEEIRRRLREAAAADRFSLLSDGAFDALDSPGESVDGIDVVLVEGEGYVRRSDFAERSYEEWAGALAAWRSGGDAGDTAYAWESGTALVVSGESVADWLGGCVEACLAGLIQPRRQAA